MREENCETKIDKIARPQSQTVHGSDFIIDGLQPIPRGLVNKDMATMLVKQTKGVLEKSFVYAHQHDGDDAGT